MFNFTLYICIVLVVTILKMIIGDNRTTAERIFSQNNYGGSYINPSGRGESDNYDSWNESFKRNNYYDFVSWLRLQSRRRTAMKTAKKYITKDRNIYRLRNKHVIFTYDSEAKIFTCKDRYNFNHAVSVVWAKQPDAPYDNDIYNTFEEFFDTICNSFNDNSQFMYILDALLDFFEIVDVKKYSKPIEQVNKSQNFGNQYTDTSGEMKYVEDKLDINTATEEQITNLPGISVIMAKRIIKYRDLHCGFESLAEFYSEMNIKPHFQRQLNDLISAEKKINITIDKELNNRIIDF